MNTKKTTTNPPWFIKKFPYIVGVIILTIIVLFVSNATFLKQTTTVSFSKKERTTKDVSMNTGVPKLGPNMLSIPSLTILAPLVYITGTTEKEFQEALANGIVHYPNTANPGQPGNSYFFGHSSDLPWSKGKFKTVFAKLPEITMGSTIYLSDNTGTVFSYKATTTNIVEPSNTSVLSQLGYKKRVLSLQTSYPVGTAQKRFIVQAELIQN